MSFSPPENSALEGIISFLASRPHSWKKWRLDSCRVFDRESRLLSQELVLTLTQVGSEIRVQYEGLQLSPSQIVQEALTAQTPSVPAPTWAKNGLLKPWKKIGAWPNSGPDKGPEKGPEIAVLEKREFSEPQIQDFYLKNQ